jgi:hypothetical protein
MAEKSSGGVKFKADYVLAYEDNGHDTLRWTTVSGNLRSTGSWRLVEAGGTTRATMSLQNEADVPISSLLKLVARPIAQHEMEGVVSAYVEAIKRALERG